MKTFKNLLLLALFMLSSTSLARSKLEEGLTEPCKQIEPNHQRLATAINSANVSEQCSESSKESVETCQKAFIQAKLDSDLLKPDEGGKANFNINGGAEQQKNAYLQAALTLQSKVPICQESFKKISEECSSELKKIQSDAENARIQESNGNTPSPDSLELTQRYNKTQKVRAAALETIKSVSECILNQTKIYATAISDLEIIIIQTETDKKGSIDLTAKKESTGFTKVSDTYQEVKNDNFVNKRVTSAVEEKITGQALGVAKNTVTGGGSASASAIVNAGTVTATQSSNLLKSVLTPANGLKSAAGIFGGAALMIVDPSPTSSCSSISANYDPVVAYNQNCNVSVSRRLSGTAYSNESAIHLLSRD